MVRLLGSEFADTSDDAIQMWIEVLAGTISRKRFGKDYNMALALLICHSLKMAGNGDNPMGAMSNTARLAAISSGKESMSFVTGTSTNDVDAEYKLTSYGLQFLNLCSRHSICITIR